MNELDFLELMNEVDDGLIERSDRDVIGMKKRTSSVWLRVGALAACVCIVAAVGFTLLRKYDSAHTGTVGGDETESVTTDVPDTTVPDIEVKVSEGRSYGLSLVQIDKESPRYADPYYEREDAEPTRTFTLLGKTVTAKYVETVEWLGSDLKDTYEDEDGNSYSFSEDGTFLSYIGENELSSFSGALYLDKGIAPDITEDDAVVIAEKLGKEVFGEAFDKVKFESISYFTGIYSVYFYQHLGADGSILGLYYHASILADGRIYSFGMPNAASFRDLDESKYELVTKDAIEGILKEKYGENTDGFPDDEFIHIQKMYGKYVLHAMVETRGGGKDINYEVTDLNNSK